MDRVVGGKFKIGRKIGAGSFGELYLGKSLPLLSPYLILLFKFKVIILITIFF